MSSTITYNDLFEETVGIYGLTSPIDSVLSLSEEVIMESEGG